MTEVDLGSTSPSHALTFVPALAMPAGADSRRARAILWPAVASLFLNAAEA